MTAHLIVCEKSGRWAAALRREAGHNELPIVEVRSLEQAERELAKVPPSIVGVEAAAANVTRVVAPISAWRITYPAARFLLLAEPELAGSEPELREAGACHVVYSTRNLAATMELVRRHLARMPQPELSLEESILAALPWGSTKP